MRWLDTCAALAAAGSARQTAGGGNGAARPPVAISACSLPYLRTARTSSTSAAITTQLVTLICNKHFTYGRNCALPCMRHACGCDNTSSNNR
jgi:hypothetical protein